MPVRSHDSAVQTQMHVSTCWWVKVFFMKRAVSVCLHLPLWAPSTRLPFDSSSSFWSVSLFCFSNFTFMLLITIFFPPSDFDSVIYGGVIQLRWLLSLFFIIIIISSGFSFFSFLKTFSSKFPFLIPSCTIWLSLSLWCLIIISCADKWTLHISSVRKKRQGVLNGQIHSDKAKKIKKKLKNYMTFPQFWTFLTHTETTTCLMWPPESSLLTSVVLPCHKCRFLCFYLKAVRKRHSY